MVTTAIILFLTILGVDAAIDLWRWNEKFDNWIPIETSIVGTAILIQEDFRRTHCAQVNFLDIKGNEITAVLDCETFDSTESEYYEGDTLQIRYNPSNPKEVVSEKTIFTEKAELTGAIFLGISASFVLGILLCCHIKGLFGLIQNQSMEVATEGDTTKTADSLELESDS